MWEGGVGRGGVWGRDGAVKVGEGMPRTRKEYIYCVDRHR